MSILATLPKPNLFSNLPTTPPPTHHPNSTSSLLHPPIPIPKYPPPLKTQKTSKYHKPVKPGQVSTTADSYRSVTVKDSGIPDAPLDFQFSYSETPKAKLVAIREPGPAFKTHHHNTKYHKPVKPGQVITTANGDRSVIVKDSGVSYRLPGAPFDFQFSYSETPKAKPVAIREPAFLPFAPPTMPRPWTGKAPMKKSKRNIKLFEPLNAPNDDDDGVDDGYTKRYEMLRAYELGKFEGKPREKVLGAPLTKTEIRELLTPCIASNRQVNIGRDGLVHNMLELIHTHWRRDPVCKVRCLGVPTVDMNNLCKCLEEKTGGKIIHRVGGVVYLFRGRNYDHRTRPKYPLMLWKPATPVYPKLIQETPEGLTKPEADELRLKGKKLPPICKLSKNGVYLTLVRDVRSAFEACPLVKIDCRGMHASDYKKLGAKLKELVPCVLLSFDDEQILMWRGNDWKPMYGNAPPIVSSRIGGVTNEMTNTSEHLGSPVHCSKTGKSSPRMMSLWKNAIDSGKAMLLDKTDLKPDDLLNKVEEFQNISQATEHTYPALVFSGKHNSDDGDGDDDEDDDYINDSFELLESTVPKGLLPVDLIVKEYTDE